MTIGHRASGQVRLAELVMAGVSSRPEVMRESAIAWVCTTPTDLNGHAGETWGHGPLQRALARLVDLGLIDRIDEPDGTRWIAREPSDEAREWCRRERRIARRVNQRIVRAA